MKVRLVLILIVLILTVKPIDGKVVIKGGYKNNEAVVNEIVIIENANYQSNSLLLPFTGYMGFPSSFLSSGNGEIEDNGSILYSLTTLTNVETKNEVSIDGIGSVKWGKTVEIKKEAISQLNVEMENGKCKIKGKNGNSTIEHDLKLNNTELNAKSIVNDEEIQYSALFKPGNSESRKVYSKLKAKNKNKVAEIESYLEGGPVEKVPPLNFDIKVNAVLENNGSVNEEINVYTDEGFQINTVGEKGNHTSITTLIKSRVKENEKEIIPTQYVPEDGKPLNVNVFPVEGLPIEQKLTLEASIKIW